jgi:hypothetical protein
MRGTWGTHRSWMNSVQKTGTRATRRLMAQCVTVAIGAAWWLRLIYLIYAIA